MVGVDVMQWIWDLVWFVNGALTTLGLVLGGRTWLDFRRYQSMIGKLSSENLNLKREVQFLRSKSQLKVDKNVNSERKG